MIQNSQNEQLIKISKWISPRLDRYEVFLFIILVAALLLRISTTLPTGIIITLSLTTLATMYFICSFSSKNESTVALEHFIKLLVGLAESMATIGILFSLMNWPSSKLMLMQGISGLMFSLLILLVMKFMKSDMKIITPRMIIRIAVIVVIGIALYFTPKESLINSGLVKEVKLEKVE